MRVLPKAWLYGASWGLVSLVSGCGAAEGVMSRVQSWWSDDAVVEAEPTPAEPVAEVVVTTGQPASGSTSGASAMVASTGAAPGATGPSSTGAGNGSTTLLMSVDRPPTTGSSGSGGGPTAGGTDGAATSTGSDGTAQEGSTGEQMGASEGTGGSERGGSTGGSTPPPRGGSVACLAGTWAIDDFATYFRRVIRVQAHGRAVRSLGSSGRYTLSFDGPKVHGEAKHLRLRYSTRLADRDVRYTVDIDGTFDTTVKMEGTDKLRITPYLGGTIRARETARFEGGKTQTRRPNLPTAGLYEIDCTATTLELSPIEGGKTRGAIRFTRP